MIALFLLICNTCAQTPIKLARIKNPPATKKGVAYAPVALWIAPAIGGPSKAPAKQKKRDYIRSDFFRIKGEN